MVSKDLLYLKGTLVLMPFKFSEKAGVFNLEQKARRTSI